MVDRCPFFHRVNLSFSHFCVILNRENLAICFGHLFWSYTSCQPLHSVLRNLWKLKSSNFVHSASMFDSYTETSDRFFILKLTVCMTSQLVPYRNFQKTKLFTQPLITTGKKDKKKIFTISNLSGVSVDC